MKFDKIHNKGQARLFEHKYLEYFTKTHPLVIWSIYIPVIVFFLMIAVNRYRLAFTTIAVAFLAGVFTWTLFEYLIHRYAFHFNAGTERATKIVYLIHGNHHEYPRDKQRLFMPPLPSLLLATTIFSILYAIAFLLQISNYIFAFFPGFLLGYLLYGSMHYAIHAWQPPFKWMKPLWRNHHMHHYKEQEKGFGVSSTLWDHVFGTMFDLKKEPDDKEKVNALMFNKNPGKKSLENSANH